ncbi:MAG TPA: hypothetical protein VGA56_06480, partial [Opitutaceae bacterium]
MKSWEPPPLEELGDVSVKRRASGHESANPPTEKTVEREKEGTAKRPPRKNRGNSRCQSVCETP